MDTSQITPELVLLVCVVVGCVIYLRDSNAERAAARHQGEIKRTADTYFQMGQFRAAVALVEPERFFEADLRIVVPPAPKAVTSTEYGLILNDALSTGNVVDNLGPVELNAIKGFAQSLANVTPMDARFFSLHQSSLWYLQSLLDASLEAGRHQAALFHSNDLQQTLMLERRSQLLHARLQDHLIQLQTCLRILASQDSYGFGKLQLTPSTLTWLYLDDIVDAM